MKQRYLNTIKLMLIAAAANIGNVAFADPPVGSRLGDRLQTNKLNNNDTAILASHRLAACLYLRRNNSVLDYLASPEIKKREKADLELSHPVECSNLAGANDLVEEQSVSASPNVWRGMLAEAALRGKGYLKNKSEILPILPIQIVYNRDWFVLTGRHAEVDTMAVCYAETNPEMVVQLLRSNPQSKEQSAIIGDVVSTLGPCLTKGMKLQVNALSLRAALAEAYFHRIYSPIVPSVNANVRAEQ